MDLKKEAALKAVGLIQPEQVIGLGAGSTIAFMVNLLAAQAQSVLQIQLLTSSFTTRQLLLQHGFTVLPVADVEKIDIYFDGCDQLDHNLHALKSGGGIHTREKLLACMATEFIIAGDYSKYVEQFTNASPLVVEFLPEALRYVPAQIRQLYGGIKTDLRTGNKKDGATITENGNYLLDVWFSNWPDVAELNSTIKNITGVVETSLFYGLVHKAIIAGEGGVQIIERQS